MAGSKRNRRRTGREARIAAAEAARRKEARRRLMLIVGGVAVVVAAVVVIVVLTRGGSDKKKASTTATTAPGPTTTTPGPTSSGPATTAAPAAGSAAGKPCVDTSDPIPAGAPAVPVKVGPPPTELVKEDLEAGTGATVAKNDTVTVNYIGVSCSTGKIFDSSYKTNKPVPVTFPLAQVIPGWQNGIPDMKVGGQRLLGIPAAQAYGAQGRPPTIAPDETLWFVVKVLDAKPA